MTTELSNFTRIMAKSMFFSPLLPSPSAHSMDARGDGRVVIVNQAWQPFRLTLPSRHGGDAQSQVFLSSQL
jgi:hypothetical protein